MEENVFCFRKKFDSEEKFKKTEDWVRYFQENPTITAVDFSVRTSEDSQDIIDITELLRTNKTLTQIIVDTRCLGEYPVIGLAKIISENNTIVSIDAYDAYRSRYTLDYFFYEAKKRAELHHRPYKGVNSHLIDALQKNFNLCEINIFPPTDSTELFKSMELTHFSNRNKQFAKASKTCSDKHITLERIDTSDLEHFFNILSPGHRVLKLEIKDCVWSEATLDSLIKYIKENQELYGLELSYQGSSPSALLLSQAIPRIARALYKHKGIVELKLKSAQCTDEGAIAIGDLLANGNTNIAFLDLSDNAGITNVGMDKIAEGVRSHQKLIELNMASCPISTDRIGIFSDALKNNSSITTLSLTFSGKETDQAKSFMDILPPPKTSKNPTPPNPPFLSALSINRGNRGAAGSNGKNTYYFCEPEREPYKSTTLQLISAYYIKNNIQKNLLISAVKSGDIVNTKRLLETSKTSRKTCSIHVLDNEQKSLLHLAVENAGENNNHVEIAKFLIQQGINTKLRDKNLETALDIAKKQGKQKFIDLINSERIESEQEELQPSKFPVSSSTPSKKQETPPGDLSPTLASKPKKLKEEEEDNNISVSTNGDFQALLCELMDNVQNEAVSKITLTAIWKLIKENSADIHKPISYRGRPYRNALNFAIGYGHYRLMKIILASTTCDPNSEFRFAVESGNIHLISRLLIDPRLSRATIQTAKNLPYVGQNIISLLEQKLKTAMPKPLGIQWVRQLSVVYGRGDEKPLVIHTDKIHAELALKNNFSKQRLFDPKVNNEDYKGNSVTASLTFIISAPSFLFGQKTQRKKITIDLDFTPSHHVTSIDEENKLARILYRASSAPRNIFEQRKGALDEGEIEKRAQGTGNNFDFYQIFHHGEQALLDYLEQEENVIAIVHKFIGHPKFISGAKVLAVILNIHSPRYACENCEVGILGEQNSEKSRFLNVLSRRLAATGCRLPQFSSLRMLTQISTYIPFAPPKTTEESVVSEDEHEDLLIDLRACHNQVILSKDLSQVKGKATQFESTKPKTK